MASRQGEQDAVEHVVDAKVWHKREELEISRASRVLALAAALQPARH